MCGFVLYLSRVADATEHVQMDRYTGTYNGEIDNCADLREQVPFLDPADFAAAAGLPTRRSCTRAPASRRSSMIDCSSRLSFSSDATSVRQMLGNIVANAVRYTDEGRIDLRVAGTDDGVVFEVSDTGPGIAAEDVPHVFDRFWRAEKSRSRRSGGSGLGLAITQHLVQAHDGQIEVRSEVGVGTTVTVSAASGMSGG